MATSLTPTQLLADTDTWGAGKAYAVSDLLGDANNLVTGFTGFDSIDNVATRVSDLMGTTGTILSSAVNVGRMIAAGRVWVDLEVDVETESEFLKARFKLSSYLVKVVRSVVNVSKKILTATGATNAVTKPIGYVSTSFSTFSTILSMIPKVIDLADKIKLRKSLDAEEDYVSQEDNKRLCFAKIQAMYRITQGDIDAYMRANCVTLKGPPMTRDEAIEALKKKKRQEIEDFDIFWGKKTFKKLEELLGDQLTGEGAYKPDIYQIEISKIEEVLNIAKSELDKTIRLQIGLAITSAVLAITSIAATVATVGFTETVLNLVTVAGYIITSLNDMYSWYTAHIGGKIDLKEKIAFGTMMAVIATTYAENTAENGFSWDTTAVAGFYMLFALTSALILQINATNEKIERRKKEVESSQKAVAAASARIKAGLKSSMNLG